MKRLKPGSSGTPGSIRSSSVFWMRTRKTRPASLARSKRWPTIRSRSIGIRWSKTPRSTSPCSAWAPTSATRRAWKVCHCTCRSTRSTSFGMALCRWIEAIVKWKCSAIRAPNERLETKNDALISEKTMRQQVSDFSRTVFEAVKVHCQCFFLLQTAAKRSRKCIIRPAIAPSSTRWAIFLSRPCSSRRPKI